MTQDETLKITSGNCELVVSVNGGRIQVFSIDGVNALVEQGIQTGSTFWPSPQSLWGWPPPPVLDEQRYDVTAVRPEKLQLCSGFDDALGVKVLKTITPINNGFRIGYGIFNHSNDIITMAPWEISRVSGGVSFYRAATEPEANSTCSIELHRGHSWYDYKVDSLQGIPKIFANNTDGWLANANNGLLLLKRFAPIPKGLVAPTEAEVEIYAHADPANPYIELEAQGPFKAIMPGAQSDWFVDWLIGKIPEEMDVSVGSEKLINYVNELINGGQGPDIKNRCC